MISYVYVNKAVVYAVTVRVRRTRLTAGLVTPEVASLLRGGSRKKTYCAEM